MLTRVEVFGVQIPMFSTLIVIGVLIGAFLLYTELKRYEINWREIIPIAFWALSISYLGGKFFNIIFFTELNLFSISFSDFQETGSMYYGNEIASFVAVAIYVKLTNLPLLKIMDSLALSFMLLHAFGRLGCFSAGCCHGVQTDSFLGVLFPDFLTHVHPTQLYEAFALFIGFFVLWPLRKKIKTPGVILSIYVIYYSVVRFLNEFLRFDAAPIGPLNISPSQNIALVLFVLALILLINRLKLYSKLK